MGMATEAGLDGQLSTARRNVGLLAVAQAILGSAPPLAFAVMIEGNAGENGLSGGGTAAPVIAKVLREIEAKPALHAVKFTAGSVIEETDPLIPPLTPEFIYGAPPPPQQVRGGSVRDFFSRILR